MVPSALTSTRIEPLSKYNYETWKMQVEALLTKNDLWEYVSGERPLPDEATGADATTVAVSIRAKGEWIKNDKKAKSDLILSIHPSELQHVRGCVTSRQVWLKLESIYASKGPARKATLLKQLMLQKLSEGGDVRDHVNKFFDAVDRLAAMDVQVHVDLLSIMLLYSLPSSYENFRCAIESRDELPTADALKVKILEESDVRNQSSVAEMTEAFAAGGSKNRLPQRQGKVNEKTMSVSSFKGKCYKCGKQGHKSPDCPTKREDTNPKSKERRQCVQATDDTFEASSEIRGKGTVGLSIAVGKDLRLINMSESKERDNLDTTENYVTTDTKFTTEDQHTKESTDRKIPCIIVLGTAGSGKTTFVQRLVSKLYNDTKPYVINLDPACEEVPYPANIDIRDTVNYKEVMKQYNLGSNDGIVTTLDLFSRKFDQVMDLIEKASEEHSYTILDTPGQIEVFTWSANDKIITEGLASQFPTIIVYVVDTVRSVNPVTFLSNMLYACSIFFNIQLPFIVVMNKIDIVDHHYALDWMQDLEAFDEALDKEDSYIGYLAECDNMLFMLNDFKKNLQCCGVSSVTGAGFNDFLELIKNAVEKYEREDFEKIKKKEVPRNSFWKLKSNLAYRQFKVITEEISKK